MTGLELLRRPSRWSLRTRLVVSVSVVLVVLCAVITAVSAVAVQRFMVDRLDDQLTTAVQRSQQFARGDQPRNPQADPQEGDAQNAPRVDAQGNPQGGPGPGFLIRPGQAEGTLGVLIENGDVVESGVLDAAGTAQALDDADLAQILALPTDGSTHTLQLDAGDYRLAASPGRVGSVIVTGLPLGPVHETVYRLTLILASICLLALIAAVFAGRFVVGRALRPLRRITATATHVAETRLDQGEVALAVRVPDPDPRTEVGQVGTALNRMLENVAAALTARHESETKVRQFVADAGHELRTPLAALQGYAELTHRSRDRTPPEVAQALDRMESAAHRMRDIVTDLLLLAQLDAGRPLERTNVDLTLLCLESVDNGRVAGSGHHWRLDLPAEPIEVLGDPLRLHQVVGNLLTNARVHTPDGTTVTVHLRQQGEEARIIVEDDGPGIPPEILPTVFERFVRADSARARADGGTPGGSTGLGLAIVSAVVAAHAGTITVESEPGLTRFTVVLPALPSRPVLEDDEDDEDTGDDGNAEDAGDDGDERTEGADTVDGAGNDDVDDGPEVPADVLGASRLRP